MPAPKDRTAELEAIVRFHANKIDIHGGDDETEFRIEVRLDFDRLGATTAEKAAVFHKMYGANIDGDTTVFEVQEMMVICDIKELTIKRPAV